MVLLQGLLRPLPCPYIPPFPLESLPRRASLGLDVEEEGCDNELEEAMIQGEGIVSVLS